MQPSRTQPRPPAVAWVSIRSEADRTMAGNAVAEWARNEQLARHIRDKALLHATAARVVEFFDRISQRRDTNGFTSSEYETFIRIAEASQPRIEIFPAGRWDAPAGSRYNLEGGVRPAADVPVREPEPSAAMTEPKPSRGTRGEETTLPGPRRPVPEPPSLSARSDAGAPGESPGDESSPLGVGARPRPAETRAEAPSGARLQATMTARTTVPAPEPPPDAGARSRAAIDAALTQPRVLETAKRVVRAAEGSARKAYAEPPVYHDWGRPEPGADLALSRTAKPEAPSVSTLPPWDPGRARLEGDRDAGGADPASGTLFRGNELGAAYAYSRPRRRGNDAADLLNEREVAGHADGAGAESIAVGLVAISLGLFLAGLAATPLGGGYLPWLAAYALPLLLGAAMLAAIVVGVYAVARRTGLIGAPSRSYADAE